MSDCLVLRLHVQPGTRTDAVAGRHGDRIKIRVTAPAVDGQANAALIRFLAREFDVQQSQVIIAGGAGGRDKRVLIHGPARRPTWMLESAAASQPASPDWSAAKPPCR